MIILYCLLFWYWLTAYIISLSLFAQEMRAKVQTKASGETAMSLTITMSFIGAALLSIVCFAVPIVAVVKTCQHIFGNSKTDSYLDRAWREHVAERGRR